MPGVVVATGVVGCLFLGGGIALVAATSARVSGVLYAASGAAALAAAAVGAGRGPWGYPAALAGVLLSSAMMAFPRWRWDVATLVAVLAVIGIPLVAGVAAGADAVGFDIAMGLSTVTLAQQWWRVESCPRDERGPLTWQLVTGVVVTLLGLAAAFAGLGPPTAALAVLATGATVVAAWIGLTRPQVVDVRGVVAEVVVDIAAVVALWVLFEVLVAVWLVAGGRAPNAAGYGAFALVPALALHPVRRQLRLVSDELLFGRRPDPVVAARQVAVGVGEDPATALEAVRTALVLPYAALRVDGSPLTETGERAEHEHTLPLVLDGRPVGELVVGLRPGDLRLAPDDVKVLGLAAPLLAQSVRARALADHLQRAREQAASAREEERLRLRRDLHDGLGPRLSGIAFTADAARLSSEDPAETIAHLERVRAEAVTAMREIRELVYAMRPPALDEVGLVEAIRLQAATFRTVDGRPMRITVAGASLPPLGAAVEVAAYRIVVEALRNAARHSGGDWARAELVAADGVLRLEVRDGGDPGPPWVPGVGLSSMRERAVELGGTLRADAGRVLAELPLRA